MSNISNWERGCLFLYNTRIQVIWLKFHNTKPMHNGDKYNAPLKGDDTCQLHCTAHNFPYLHRNCCTERQCIHKTFTKFSNFTEPKYTTFRLCIEIPEYHKSLHNTPPPLSRCHVHWWCGTVENLQYTCKMSSTPKCVCRGWDDIQNIII